MTKKISSNFEPRDMNGLTAEDHQYISIQSQIDKANRLAMYAAGTNTPGYRWPDNVDISDPREVLDYSLGRSNPEFIKYCDANRDCASFSQEKAWELWSRTGDSISDLFNASLYFKVADLIPDDVKLDFRDHDNKDQ